MNICDNDKCTGCALCAVLCPQQCIVMDENIEGFLYPRVNEEYCISCKSCQRHCPANNLVSKNVPVDSAVCAWSTDEQERFSSSSGGVFPELAKMVLDHTGTVYGAAFDCNNNLRS